MLKRRPHPQRSKLVESQALNAKLEAQLEEANLSLETLRNRRWVLSLLG